MTLAPGTLPRHELVGLQAEVVEAADREMVGIAGEIVTETTKTLAIEGSRVGRPSGAQPNEEAVSARPNGERPRNGEAATERSEGAVESERAADRVWHVPKADVTLVITLPSGEAVTVEGDVLVARPARRTEDIGDTQWR
jgi:ribonuclease P protein subunit POP4